MRNVRNCYIFMSFNGKEQDLNSYVPGNQMSHHS